MDKQPHFPYEIQYALNSLIGSDIHLLGFIVGISKHIRTHHDVLQFLSKYLSVDIYFKQQGQEEVFLSDFPFKNAVPL